MRRLDLSAWLVLLAAAAMVLVWGYLLGAWWPAQRPDVADAAPNPAASEPEPPAVLFIGDSYTGGSAMNSGPTWEERLADRRDWAAVEDAVGGTGYLAKSELGPSLAERLPATLAEYDPDAVVVALGLNDSGLPYDRVIDTAADVMADLRAGFPGREVVVLSPFSPRPIPAVERLRDGLEEVAGDAGLPYVDVTDAFYGRPDLIGKDGTHPTDGGHAHLARVVEQRLDEALTLP